MKTLLIAINSRYIHAALAPWYLQACCAREGFEAMVAEYSINDTADGILGRIYTEKPDIAAFSCYIWNIELVLKLTADLKKVLPETVILLGGPEVSFDVEDRMQQCPQVDFILSGEGEEAFVELIRRLHAGESGITNIPGVASRWNGQVVYDGAFNLIKNLEALPSPYTPEMLERLGSRITYLEGSRGCPFSCSYCLSSTFDGVRFFPAERVEAEILKLVRAGVHQVKFVDRTFNCNRERAKRLIGFILELSGNTCFHFEAAGDLFDEELLSLLAQAPPGRIQLEIGLQSTNLHTLELVGRKTALDQLFSHVRQLLQQGNLHLHLDLIAGLPEEDFASFRQSFNQVYGLQPHQLQLGFLKMLRGSRIREEAALYQYRFRETPPYEILENKRLSYQEILRLKGVEDLVERYYNSGRFSKTLPYLITGFPAGAFDFYLALSQYFLKKGWAEKSLSARALYGILMEFAAEGIEGIDPTVVGDLLRFDYLVSDNSGSLPEGLSRPVIKGFREAGFEFLKEEGNIRRCLPQFNGMPAKQIYKQVHFEELEIDVETNEREPSIYLFDYSCKNPVTGLYRVSRVDLRQEAGRFRP